jgi:hypothetical protein
MLVDARTSVLGGASREVEETWFSTEACHLLGLSHCALLADGTNRHLEDIEELRKVGLNGVVLLLVGGGDPGCPLLIATHLAFLVQ